jgi:hypothetical protein
LTLAEDAARIRSGFDSIDTEEFLDVVSHIRDRLHTGQTREYLGKKLEAARLADPSERRGMCRNLLPYLDWYLSGS